MIRQQRTLEKPMDYDGIGLHTGNPVKMRILPAPVNSGVSFRRLDLDPPVTIEANICNAPQKPEEFRNTTLSKNGVSIHTVEHILATLTGLGIDNCVIELDANEPAEPSQGSCEDYVRAIKEAGIVGQGAPVRYFEVTQPISLVENEIELLALPYDGFRISFTIKYDHPHLGTQYASFDLTPKTFEEEIAKARTFVLLDDVEQLKEKGLIQGGTLENAIVVGPDGIMNDSPLRYPNEFVRHKILDIMGDLSLLGMPIKGHIISHKSGHYSNVQFAHMLAETAERQDRVFAGGSPMEWNIRDITRIMPHRYPFLLVDRLTEMEDRKRVVGIKNVTVNEPFFQGHFPGHPIFPAVLILEAMAQTGGVLLLSTVDNPKGKLVYFMGIDNARFRKPVLPGDQLRLELTMIRLKKRGCKMHGQAFVDGDLVAEAELLAQVVEV